MFAQRKLIVVIAIIVALSMLSIMTLFIKDSFTKNEYVVKVNYCNSEKSDTLVFTTSDEREMIRTYREAVPVLQIGKKEILNVCAYEIISKKKID
jgi:hypothetical protein